MTRGYANYVTEATDKEIAIYNKVEIALHKSGLDICDFIDLLYNKVGMDNLLNNKITNKRILHILKDLNVTVEDICTWIFIDVM